MTDKQTARIENSISSMKIAFFVTQFPSLSQSFVLNQITGLMDLGHNVDIFAKAPGDNSKFHDDVMKYGLLERTTYFRDIYKSLPPDQPARTLKGLKYVYEYGYKHPIPIIRSLNVFKYRRQATSFRLLTQVVSLLERSSYDVIQCHFGPMGIMAATLREIGALRGKLVTVFHGFDLTTHLKKTGRHVYGSLFQMGDLFLPISQRWKELLIDMGCPPEKVVVHKMGIDTRKFGFVPRSKENDGKIVALTVARLVEKKGVEYAVKAFAKTLGTYPNMEYLIAGDGPLKAHISSLVKNMGIESKVKLLGWKNQEEILDLMNKAHIFLCPSVTAKEGDQEGIPVAIMEAMATGMPVLTSNHSGIPELVQHGLSGFIVPERDVDALSDKLSYLVNHPEIWSEMGSVGTRFVEENHEIRKLNHNLTDLFQDLLLQN